MNFIVKQLTKQGLKKGNKTLGAIGLVITLINLLRKVSGTAPKTLFTHELKPGDTVAIIEPKQNK